MSKICNECLSKGRDKVERVHDRDVSRFSSEQLLAMRLSLKPMRERYYKAINTGRCEDVYEAYVDLPDLFATVETLQGFLSHLRLYQENHRSTWKTKKDPVKEIEEWWFEFSKTPHDTFKVLTEQESFDTMEG